MVVARLHAVVAQLLQRSCVVVAIGREHAAVARAKEGDREAVRYLYLRYSDNVYGYVRSIVRDDYEAEDITQHVFAKLMAVLPKDEQLRRILAHNRDEEIEHAMMALEYLRRMSPVFDGHMRTYLFTEGDITEIEEKQ